ncbi:MAG: IS110 family transposase [Pseudomonadota bacterium]|nr:IS110 family transposase [Pseudomonadota bacterium]
MDSSSLLRHRSARLEFVKPYLKSRKNDANDAEAIREAVGRPNMRFVTAKAVARQGLLAVHRIRSELVRQRTAKANQIRGLLAEYGVIVPVGINALRRALPEIQEDAENGLSGLFRRLLEGLRADLVELDRRVDQLDGEIQAAAKEDETARRLQTVPGIGPITATALAASVGDGRQFRHGRDRAAWLGLTPRQHSSGGKDRLLGMSKRGDGYLRTLLIHGARGRPGRGQQDRPAQPLDYRGGGATAQKRGLALAGVRFVRITGTTGQPRR